jgi:hypothetical protein
MKKPVHLCYVEECTDPYWDGLNAICAETHELGGIATYLCDGAYWRGIYPTTTPERAAAFLDGKCDAEHVLA